MAAGRGRVLIAAAGLALTIAVTGCTSGESKSAGSAVAATAAGVTQAAGAPAAPAATSAAAAASAAAGTSAAGTAAASAAPAPSAAAGTSAAASSAAPANNGLIENRPPPETDPTAGRSIIYTAQVDLQVKTAADVETTAQKIADVADANGYVFSRSDQEAANTAGTPTSPISQPDGIATADLVLKVTPGGAYDSLINDIKRLGTTLDFTEKTSDVTDKVVDTQSRLTAQKASVARIRVLLEKATTIGQIVQVEGELTRREADLESLEGTLAVLKSQTALATITVHLESAPVPTPSATPTPTVPPTPKKHIHGFGGGLKAGSHSFVTGAVGFATVLGALLPYLALALVLLVIAFFVRRSALRGRRTAVPPETTATH
jgi:hypothetical protein